MTKDTTVLNAADLAARRRSRYRLLWVVSWSPVIFAAAFGLFLALRIRNDGAKLTQLRTDLESSRNARDDLLKQSASLRKDVEERERKVLELEERVKKLSTSAESIDPEVVIAKIRRQLGGRNKDERADALWSRGRDSYEAGQLALAERLYEAANAEQPHFAAPLIGLGRIAADRGQLLTAEKFYKKAIDADPNSAHAFYSLAVVGMLRRHYDEAEKNAHRTLELDPSYEKAAQLLKEIAQHR